MDSDECRTQGRDRVVDREKARLTKDLTDGRMFRDTGKKNSRHETERDVDSKPPTGLFSDHSSLIFLDV